MSSSRPFDAAVIGGGVIGCATALNLARGGMRVVLFERDGLCRAASGRNAGTLTMLYTRASLIPYALRGREMWRDADQWLGRDAGFQHRHGMELAFSERVAEELAGQHRLRAEAGAPIEMIGGNRAREIEPALSEEIVGAAYSEVDGYAKSYGIGVLFHAALREAGVTVRDGTPVLGIEPGQGGHVVRWASGETPARLVVMTSNVWIGKMAAWFGVRLPIAIRVNQGTISERLRPLFKSILRVPNELSLKQFEDGTVLMGGGRGEHWVEDPDLGEVQQDITIVKSKMAGAAHCAQRVVPALRQGRVVRTWTGYEGFAPDNQPLIGPMPGVEGVYVAAALRSGFTIGPFAGRLLADQLLGREPEMPIFPPAFDPARVIGMEPFDKETTAQVA
jgi:glycine/D-amino acid oxidase-like deaminating enzyme